MNAFQNDGKFDKVSLLGIATKCTVISAFQNIVSLHFSGQKRTVFDEKWQRIETYCTL